MTPQSPDLTHVLPSQGPGVEPGGARRSVRERPRIPARSYWGLFCRLPTMSSPSYAPGVPVPGTPCCIQRQVASKQGFPPSYLLRREPLLDGHPQSPLISHTHTQGVWSLKLGPAGKTCLRCAETPKTPWVFSASGIQPTFSRTPASRAASASRSPATMRAQQARDWGVSAARDRTPQMRASALDALLQGALCVSTYLESPDPQSR